MKAYYSIADLQALELVGLPTTRRGLEKYVLNKQFKYREVPSRGKGGLRKEYELSDELTQQVVLKQMKSELASVVNYEQPLELSVASNLPNANDLVEWQREVAENRLFVVRFIQNNMLSGIKKTKAVEDFIAQAITKTLPEDM
jgi:putative transposase